MEPQRDETAKPTRRLLPGESAFGWFLLAFGAFVFYQSYRIAGFSSVSSAGGTPMAAAFLMMVTAVTIIVNNARSPQLETRSFGEAVRRFQAEMLPLQPLVFYVFIILLYMLAMEPLGFNLASFLFLFASFWYLHDKGWWLALWASTLNVVIIYVLFQVIFQVVLPEGTWIDAAMRLVGWR